MTSEVTPELFSTVPDAAGRFGRFGGKFVAETLMSALADLERLYADLKDDPAFQREFDLDLAHYVGRPSPLYEAARLSDDIGGARIFLKREDLNHTGAHKVNNTIGQALLAKYMGKKRVIAETGAGQHGVASATVAARLGLECHVFMGEEDIRRQALNVYRMKLLGAHVVSVTSGSRTLKDAMNEAMRDWVTHIDDTFYIIGTVAGPHPYPMLVRDFQVLSAAKRAPSRWLRPGSCLTRWWPVLAAVPTRSAYSIPFCKTPAWRCTALRRAARVSKLVSMRRRYRQARRACCMGTALI